MPTRRDDRPTAPRLFEPLEKRKLLANFLVDTLADESDGDFSAGDLSLREAIEMANANPDTDTIRFDTSLQGGTITLNGTDLDITESVRIFGPGARLLTIDGNDNSRIFDIDNGDNGTLIDVIIRDLTLTGGNASGLFYGGAVLNYESLVLRRMQITGNRVSVVGGEFGGGIAVKQGASLELRESAVYGNSGESGAGIFGATNSVVMIRNSTISGNRADNFGGGIMTGGSTTIYNSTITDNHADDDDSAIIGGDGGGIYIFAGSTTVISTIVADNYLGSGTSTEDDIRGTVDPASVRNLVGTGGAGGLTDGVNNNQVGVSNPGLLPLGNYGGQVDTHAIEGVSPARDAGSNPLGLSGDGRDAIFGRFVGPRPDIGAFERQTVNVVVSTAADELDTDYSPGDLSLREALNLANNTGLDTIAFDPALNGSTIYLKLGDIDVLNRFTLTGPGSSNITIDGNNEASIRVDSPSPSTVSISGLSIVHGFSNAPGGALFADVAGNLILDDLVMRRNTSASSGGALEAIAAGDLTASRITATHNAANTSGGGINLAASGHITLTHATLNNNTNNLGVGGGGVVSTSGDITLHTINANRNVAGSTGGGLYVQASGELMGQAITANFNSTIDAGGGAAFIGGGSTTLIDINTNRNTTSSPGGGLYADSSGVLSVNGLTANDNRTVSSNGGGAFLDSNANVILRDATISSNYTTAQGGGVYIDANNNATLENVQTNGNTTTNQGGGIVLQTGRNATLTSVTASGNRSVGSGGGLLLNAGMVLTAAGLQVNNNQTAGTGGGIFVTAGMSSSFSDTTINNNSVSVSGTGGGLFSQGVAMTLQNVTVNGNTAGTAGGVLIDNNTSITISNLTVSGNVAISGVAGGAHLTAPSIDVNGLHASGNTAGSIAGGAYIIGFTTLTLTDATASENRAINGPGGGFYLSGSDIVAHNVAATDNRTAGIGGGVFVASNTFVADGFEFSRNTIDGASPQSGAGAYLNATNTEIENGTAIGNRAAPLGSTGGGIFAVSTNFTIEDSIISDNKINGQGGGLYLTGSTMTVTRTTITDNTTKSGANNGGGIYANATNLIVNASDINQNRAEGVNARGGGIYSLGSVALNRSTVAGNWAQGNGGGLYATGGDVDVIASTIARNEAIGNGGGIYDQSNTFDIRNSTISSNTARGNGGGIVATTAVTTIDNSTIAYNRADADVSWSGLGGGIYSPPMLVCLVTLRSTIVGFNTRGNELSDVQGDMLNPSSVRSLIRDADTSGGLTNGVNNNLVGVNPQLDPLADNGGPTQTHALRTGSPAINTGSNPNGLNWDQRNAGFDRTVGIRADIGAFEVQASPLLIAEPAPTTPQGPSETTQPTPASYARFVSPAPGSSSVGERAEPDANDTHTPWWYGPSA